MRGTLALWYERHEEGPNLIKTPSVELHFNLWRELSGNANLFDVGFLLTDVLNLGRFFLFIPGPISLEQIRDLSHLLQHGSSLNAVFNEVIKIDHREEHSFTTTNEGSPFLRIHHVSLESDLSVEFLEIDPNTLGTVINFAESFCDRIRIHATEQHYIRLRFLLDHRTAGLFSSELKAPDWWLLSSFVRTELTEFRLNERRSFPPSIAEWADQNSFVIKRVQYFLVRDFHHELVMQHATFRKVRRLEGELWRHYLWGRLPGDESGPDLLPAGAADRMVIYHWRKDSSEKEPIEDFIAFASFRSPISNIFFFAAAIVTLGALGAALSAFTSELLRRVIWRIGSTEDVRQSSTVDELALNGFTLIVLASLVAAVFFTARWWFDWRKTARSQRSSRS